MVSSQVPTPNRGELLNPINFAYILFSLLSQEHYTDSSRAWSSGWLSFRHDRKCMLVLL